jgi:hypothetical protein
MNCDFSEKIELMNITGQRVFRENANISNGTLYKSVSIPSSLSAGMYMVKVIVDDKTYHAKLLYLK